MKGVDLVYVNKGLFVSFYAQTEQGLDAYNEIVRVTEDGYVRADHLKSTLKQLRQAGYRVRKAKKLTDKDVNKVLKEFDELFENNN